MDFLNHLKDYVNIQKYYDKLNKLVEVTYKDGKFWCDHDEKDCCTHIHFALALPELAKLNR